MNDYPEENAVKSGGDKLNRLWSALRQVLFGQDDLTRNVIVGLVANGHILLEGLPGLGKTELVKGLARAIGLESKRIQFTPDLLPGDITGNPVLEEKDGSRVFVFQPGPVFGNLILADEINRASPKTQSALLEAMQEQRVTVMGNVHELPCPFFVVATQNPIELEGTYPLPEAQIDRFLFKLEVGNNPADVLEKIVKHRELGVEPKVEQVMTRDELLELMALSRSIYMPDAVANYIARLVNASHEGCSESSRGVKFGASPRAAIGLAAAAKARALFDGRINASFEDVKAVAVSVLQHRIILNYDAKLEGRTGTSIVKELLEEVSEQDVDLPYTLESDRE